MMNASFIAPPPPPWLLEELVGPLEELDELPELPHAASARTPASSATPAVSPWVIRLLNTSLS